MRVANGAIRFVLHAGHGELGGGHRELAEAASAAYHVHVAADQRSAARRVRSHGLFEEGSAQGSCNLLRASWQALIVDRVVCTRFPATKAIFVDHEPLPAGLVKPTSQQLTWIVDEAAAADLPPSLVTRAAAQ